MKRLYLSPSENYNFLFSLLQILSSLSKSMYLMELADSEIQ